MGKQIYIELNDSEHSHNLICSYCLYEWNFVLFLSFYVLKLCRILLLQSLLKEILHGSCVQLVFIKDFKKPRGWNSSDNVESC
jgi:hypothetical protein